MEDNGAFIKSLFRRQAPINIFALLLSTIGPIVCAGLAGTHFGSDGLAITAICAPLFLAASFFGFIISGGAQIVCSVFIAKDELDNVNKVYSAAVTLTLMADVLICAALLAAKTPVLTFMAGEISPELSAYYSFFVLNAFATMLIYIPLFFSKIVGRNEIGMVLTGIMSALSIIASLLLIRFMGIGAIALGQAIGTAAGFTVSMVMLRKHFKFVFPKELYVKAIFVSGSPVGLTRLYILFTTIILNALFLRVGGGGALAVFGVVSMLHRFSTAFIVGISQTLVPLVSVFNEEQDITSIKQTMKLAFRYGNVLMLIAGVVFVVFNAQIAGIFGLPADSGFFAAMPFYAVYGILVLNTSIFSSYYNAAKKLKLANAIPFLQEFALLCGGAYILSAGFGINGIWVAFPLSGVLTLLITAFLLVAVRFRQKDLSFLLLQSRKLEKDGRYISFSVENKLEKASEAAAKISDFCEESGLPPKQTMQISMSVEEIITLIINKNKTKDFSVSVRLFILEGTIILRFRNAGEKFDAVEYYKENIADDIEKNLDIIGMKYITQSANVIYYRQTFGVNSLVVIL